METIDVEVKINKTVDVSVRIEDVLEAIELLPTVRKWNYVAQMINDISLCVDDLTDDQKQIVRVYLNNKIKLFEQEL